MTMPLELKRASGQRRAAEEPKTTNREIKLRARNQRCDNGNSKQLVSASVSRGNDSFAFFHGKEAVNGGNRYFFLCSAWPADLHFVYFPRRTEAKMEALVGTRCIATSAEDVTALPHASGCDKYLRPDRVARAFGASQQL